MSMRALKLSLAAAALVMSVNAASAQPYPPPPPAPPAGPGAPPPPPPPPALDACRVDVQRYCQGIRPGQGRIRACMRSNQDRLSPACKNAIVGVIEKRRNMREERRQNWGYPPRPPRPPAPPASMAPVPN